MIDLFRYGISFLVWVQSLILLNTEELTGRQKFNIENNVERLGGKILEFPLLDSGKDTIGMQYGIELVNEVWLKDHEPVSSLILEKPGYKVYLMEFYGLRRQKILLFVND